MGIDITDADIIVQEHCYRPLPATVYLIGRQSMLFDYRAACDLLARHGLTPRKASVEIDQTTLGAISAKSGFITDTTFFRMLGVETVLGIDHSDYEGAEIIVDLNRPLPPALEGVADFIVGGSVLDNVFDPVTYIQNLSRLLRPGGRLIDSNTCCFRGHPYVIVPPAWFLDFCVLNQFADCALYMSESGPTWSASTAHMYRVEVNVEADIVPDLGNVASGMQSGTTLIAEKDEVTTWNQLPSQDQYRSDEEWQRYRQNLKKMKRSLRPWLKYARPSPMQLAAYPIRRVKGMHYIGWFDPGSETFDPAQTASLMDESAVDGIRVIEATYGWNQRKTEMTRTSIVPLYRGNSTGIMSFLLNGRDGCDWEIDVKALGDPAPGLPKDLSVLYYFAQDPSPRIQHVYVSEEAHGQRLLIPKYNWKKKASAYAS
jgi:hypothetical protein